MYGKKYWDRSQSETVAGEWQAVERQESYPLTLSNAVVPALAGLFVSVPAGIAAAVVVWLATDLVLWWAGVLTMAGVWFLISLWVLNVSLGVIKRWESYTGGRGDSESEASEKVVQTLRLEVINPGDRRMQFAEFPIDGEAFKSWARAVLGGRGLSVGTWTGSAGLFSRQEYDALTDYLIRAGLMRWINPAAHNQGRELTSAGRATLRRFVESDMSDYALEG